MPRSTDVSDVAPLLDRLRQRLAALYGERLVRTVLYGSCARGDARPDSDVDVAVVLRGPVNPADEVDRTANLVADAVLEHGRFVSLYPLSEADYEAAERGVVRAIRAEGIVR